MLPTDAAMEHGSNCNAIQNALQKVNVHISFDQAAIVLIELRRELPELFRLRRKDKKESGKTVVQQTQAKMPSVFRAVAETRGDIGGHPPFQIHA